MMPRSFAFLTVLGVLMLGASCTSTKQPTEPVPTPDPTAAWPVDSGWRSANFPVTEKGRYILTTATTSKAFFVLVNNTLGNGEYIQELWKTVDGEAWIQCDLPIRSYLTNFESIDDQLIFQSVDSGVAIQNAEGVTIRKWGIPPSIQVNGFFKHSAVAYMTRFREGLLVSIINYGSRDSVILALLTDTGLVPQNIRFPKTLSPPSDLFETSTGELLVSSDSLYHGDLSTQSPAPSFRWLGDCPIGSCIAHYATGITEYDGKLWMQYGTYPLVRRDPTTLAFYDSVTNFQHSDTFDLEKAYQKTGLVYRAEFVGLQKHDSLLFVCGTNSVLADYLGVWVWSRKRQRFHHVPLQRRGIRYADDNYRATSSVKVWRDTLYAATSRGLYKRALSDIQHDLDLDTLPWSP